MDAQPLFLAGHWFSSIMVDVMLLKKIVKEIRGEQFVWLPICILYLKGFPHFLLLRVSSQLQPEIWSIHVNVKMVGANPLGWGKTPSCLTSPRSPFFRGIYPMNLLLIQASQSHRHCTYHMRPTHHKSLSWDIVVIVVSLGGPRNYQASPHS